MLMHVVVWAVCVTLLPLVSMTSRPEVTKADRPLSILD